MSITKIVSNILNQSIGIAGCGEMGYPMLKMLLQNDINATGHDIKASKNFKNFGERYIPSKSHFFEKNVGRPEVKKWSNHMFPKNVRNRFP